MGEPPEWLHVLAPRCPIPPFSPALGTGEQQAIALAEGVNAEALLVDDWAARQEATRRQLTVVGTLRSLSSAAQRGLLDLPLAVARLCNTNFRASQELVQFVLDEAAARKKN